MTTASDTDTAKTQTTGEGAPSTEPGTNTSTEQTGKAPLKFALQQQPEPAKPAETPEPPVKKQSGPDTSSERYTLKPTEGSTIDAKVVDTYAEAAHKLGISQEQAQKLLDTVSPTIGARQTEMLDATRKQWLEETRTAKDIGGDRLDESLAKAAHALDKFGTPALRELLDASGLGNHPDMVRAWSAVGRAISEDTVVTTNAPAAPPVGSRTSDQLAAAMFGSPKK